ncbi:hypothetical protein [Serratia marcescens]|uniref:hypothetical protein n=1 Tax=Serratia marcescens TaxID=615 RepID=UPI0025AA3D15|nr:hypothetical protein [Serratia marcescens]MDN0028530.1 hypothetical protein [Serratia marcescens]
MKNNLVNQDIKTDKPLAMSYEALKADRDAQQKRADALAVESVELRHIAERIVNALYAAGYEPEENSLHPWKSLIFDAEKALNTPATDTALEAIEARGVEKLADKLDAEIEQIMSGAFFYDEISSREAISKMVREYATELREAK